MAKRFFAEDSFWNTKIEKAPALHPQSDHYVKLLAGPNGQDGFHMNLYNWTLPIYEVTRDTPTVNVEKRIKYHTGEGRQMYVHSQKYVEAVGEENHRMGHAPGFGKDVPIPEDAIPDKQSDSHMSLVDYERGLAWDMWGAQQRPDGQWWSCSGITYDLYGSGVFDPDSFPIHNGESIHMYGGSHAAGVPNVAGVVMYDELMEGRIEHKLTWACKFTALLEHIYPPTVWTDGGYPNGIPMGVLLQLDPDLDLTQFHLTEYEMVLARALQEYGAVPVMTADSTTLFGEGLWAKEGKSWDGILTEEGMMKIPFKHYRFIQSGTSVEKGMIPNPHPGIMSTYYRATGLPDFDYKGDSDERW